MIGGESMKQRQILASAFCVLALAACNKKPEEAVTTTAQATVRDNGGTDDCSPDWARDVFWDVAVGV